MTSSSTCNKFLTYINNHLPDNFPCKKKPQEPTRSFFINSKPLSNSTASNIQLNANQNEQYPFNIVKTSRYTVLTFLPKNLIEQFTRLANFWFVVIAILQLNGDSPVNPVSSIVPLVFVMSVTAIKQAYEDFLRHRSDAMINNRIVKCLKDKKIVDLKSSKLRIGDIIKIHKNESFPCDLVCINSSLNNGECLVTTANLDGETNLKTLMAVPETKDYKTAEELDDLLRGIIVCESPNSNLYQFTGKMTLEIENDVQTKTITVPLTSSNLLLCGAVLKNTEYVYGCCVYTGLETKMQLNSKQSAAKKSVVEKKLNKYIMIFMLIMLWQAIFCTVMKHITSGNVSITHATYLPDYLKVNNSFDRILLDFLGFLILFNYLIPISLYVTIEFQKFFGCKYFNNDEEMTFVNPETAEVFPSKANTSDLNEELGQIEYIFSDKTGTLTENTMTFRGCSINGQKYVDLDEKLFRVTQSGDFQIVSDLDMTAETFFTALTLCHSVKIEDKNELSNVLKVKKFSRQEAKNYVYEASSPDEKAFLEASRNYGIIYHGYDITDEMVITVGEIQHRFKLVYTLPFDSTRKRMSVIVKRMSDGDYWLVTKGAESSMLDKCTRSDRNIVDITIKHCDDFATSGLRVIVVAFRPLTKEDFNNIKYKLEGTTNDILNREKLLQEAYEEIEDDLTLLGATVVEDELQDGVEETLVSLRQAGIKIWVLTGDKTETAENISLTAGHFSEDMERVRIVEQESRNGCLDILNSNLEYTVHRNSIVNNQKQNRNFCLIVDGQSLSFLLQENDKILRDTFLSVCQDAAAVLCSRCTPLQKSLVVSMVKNGVKPTPVTCAVGDGANDVSMIKEAHVGFGLYGKEGRAAALNADYALGKFKFLKKALFYHGHLFYLRIAVMVQYFFYKNVAFVTAELFYAFFSAFSAQTPFDPFFLTIYNIFMTSLPILLYGLFEQQISKKDLLKKPYLYAKLSKNAKLKWLELLKWSVLGFWHCFCSFFGVLIIFQVNDCISIPPEHLGLFSFGFIVVQSIYITVNLKLLIETYYWCWATVIGLCVTVFGNLMLWSIFSVIPANILQANVDLFYVYFVIMAQPVTWLILTLLTVVALLPDLLLRAIRDTKLATLRKINDKNNKNRNSSPLLLQRTLSNATASSFVAGNKRLSLSHVLI